MFSPALTRPQAPSESAARANRFAAIRKLAKTRLARDYYFSPEPEFGAVRAAYVSELRQARLDLYPTRLEYLESRRDEMERSDVGLLNNANYQRICDEIRELRK